MTPTQAIVIIPVSARASFALAPFCKSGPYAMLSIRGIVFPLTGMLLAGCMQSGTLAPSSEANFTARDRQQLANPPYQRVSISLTYQRQIVQYHRREASGSILVETSGPFVYYVLPGGNAIRYGAAVGEAGQAWSGVATVGRKEEWPGWTPVPASVPPDC
jgi:lipoprotein-anchoring transpeptidase ErfK/SrfK